MSHLKFPGFLSFFFIWDCVLFELLLFPDWRLSSRFFFVDQNCHLKKTSCLICRLSTLIFSTHNSVALDCRAAVVSFDVRHRVFTWIVHNNLIQLQITHHIDTRDDKCAHGWELPTKPPTCRYDEVVVCEAVNFIFKKLMTTNWRLITSCGDNYVWLCGFGESVWAQIQGSGFRCSLDQCANLSHSTLRCWLTLLLLLLLLSPTTFFWQSKLRCRTNIESRKLRTCQHFLPQTNDEKKDQNYPSRHQ